MAGFKWQVLGLLIGDFLALLPMWLLPFLPIVAVAYFFGRKNRLCVWPHSNFNPSHPTSGTHGVFSAGDLLLSYSSPVAGRICLIKPETQNNSLLPWKLEIYNHSIHIIFL